MLFTSFKYTKHFLIYLLELSPLFKPTYLPLNEITSNNSTDPNIDSVDKVEVSNEKIKTSVETTPIKSESETLSDQIKSVEKKEELNVNETKIQMKSNPDSKDIIQFIFRLAIFVS